VEFPVKIGMEGGSEMARLKFNETQMLGVLRQVENAKDGG
jgi:hypothetical protein